MTTRPAMSAVLHITAKDLRQRLRDRSLPLLAIVVPLALAAVFSLLFGNVAGDQIARFAIADRDGGAIAGAFTDTLRSLERDGLITLRTATSAREAGSLAESGEVAAALVIPEGFSAAVTAGRATRIEVIGNAEASFGTGIARSIAESFSARLHSASLAVAVATGGAPVEAERAAELAAGAAAAEAPLIVRDVAAQTRELSLRTFFAAGMAVFFLFFTVQFGVTSLLEERRDGTLARLLAAPIPRRAILLGKLGSGFTLGLISMTVLVVAGGLLLGARWGDPLGVALLVLAGVLAATGITAVIATFARTAEQAGNWQSIVAVVLGMLGGVFVPIGQTDGVLSWLGYATPHKWFMQGLADLSAGGSAAVVTVPVLALLGFAVVTGGLATLRLGRMLRP